MKTHDRLYAIDASEHRLRSSIPEAPLAEMQLMRLIRVASQGISACVEPALRPRGLNESALHTLVIIISAGASGVSPSALCDQVGQTRANMTRILNVLLKQKLIASKTDGTDGRSKRMSVTAAGQKLAKTCAEIMTPIVSSAMSGLDDKEKQTFEKLLRKLIHSMGVQERSFASL